MTSNDEQGFAAQMRQQVIDSAVRSKAIFDELEARRNSTSTTNAAPSVESQDLTRAEALNKHVLEGLNANHGELKQKPSKFLALSATLLRLGVLLCTFGALAQLVLLLKGDERSSFVTGLTELFSIVLRVLGYFYIPVVFGGLAILHLTGRFKVDLIVILLAVLALCPQLFPILAEYMEEFSLGLQGFRAKPRASVIRLGQAESSSTAPTPGSGSTQPAAPANVFRAMGAVPVGELPAPAMVFIDDARKILKTLWHYQKTLYPSNSSNRWCFTVPIRSADYMAFSLGQLQLISAELIGIDGRGYTFLNDRGLSYCVRFDREILEFMAIYDNFRSD